MYKIGVTRQVTKAELSACAISAEETLLLIIESVVLRYSMMYPAPFPDWYEERIKTVIKRLQVDITDATDHHSLLICGFMVLDNDEYVPDKKQLTEDSAAANAFDYSKSLDERVSTHIRKMITSESFERYANTIQQALISNSDVVRKVKIERADDMKSAQCCGLCTHYMTSGYACGENKTPITFPLYPTDGKICGQFKERKYE